MAHTPKWPKKVADDETYRRDLEEQEFRLNLFEKAKEDANKAARRARDVSEAQEAERAEKLAQQLKLEERRKRLVEKKAFADMLWKISSDIKTASEEGYTSVVSTIERPSVSGRIISDVCKEFERLGYLVGLKRIAPVQCDTNILEFTIRWDHVRLI